MSALQTRGAALARPDGTVALVIGDPSDTDALTAALVSRGHVVLTSGTTPLDPDTLEVHGAEARLLVVPRPDPDALDPRVRRLTGGEAAHVVGSRSIQLDAVRGGPLAALARLARRVPAYEVRYADPVLGAREVVRLWSTH